MIQIIAHGTHDKIITYAFTCSHCKCAWLADDSSIDSLSVDLHSVCATAECPECGVETYTYMSKLIEKRFWKTDVEEDE